MAINSIGHTAKHRSDDVFNDPINNRDHRRLDDLLLGVVARLWSLHWYFRNPYIERPINTRGGARHVGNGLYGRVAVLPHYR